MIGLKKQKIDSRKRVLNDKEIRSVWMAAQELMPYERDYIELLLMVGQRTGEVGGICWEEINLERRTWIFSEERSKNGRAHLVPLTDQLIAILKRDRPLDTRRGLLLKNMRGGPFDGTGNIKKRLDRIIAETAKREAELAGTEYIEMVPFRLHDIRRTFATGLQSLGVPVEHTEALLNHVSGETRSSLIDVYQLYEYQDEKRAALEKWHAHLKKLMS